MAIRYLITDKKAWEEEISIQNERLKKANAEMDNFVYRVSHYLRAPIASALGIVDLCLIAGPEPEVTDLLSKQQISLKKLDQFIRDILNYSRNARMEVQKVRTDLRAVIESVISQSDGNYPEVEVRISVKEPVPLITDLTRLEIILGNLVSNAFKFMATNRQDGYLQIQARIGEDSAVIELRDNGIGIHPDHLDKVFNMFYRATQQNYGSGLGLYIAKEAVHNLKGKIKVSSDLGKGTVFTLSLPNYAEE